DQVAAMADPERVQLLNLILTDHTGELTAKQIAGITRDAADVAWVRGHLDRLAGVGLLMTESTPYGTAYRPSHDALVRFGSVAGSPLTDVTTFSDHEQALERVSRSLVKQFGDTLAAETIRDFVAESYDLLASRATVRRFLPQLTERFAAERLD